MSGFSGAKRRIAVPCVHKAQGAVNDLDARDIFGVLVGLPALDPEP